MKNWFVKHDIVARALSLIAAILLWSYIMNTQNPSRTLEYRSIPVTFVGLEDLYNNYNLTVIDGSDTTVNVKVSAPSNRLANLTASQIKVQVDLSDITSAGTYDMVYKVGLPESGMTCVGSSPDSISITVDKEYTKSVPVEVHIDGNLPDGYSNEKPKLSTETVNITGPESEIDKVNAAVVTIAGRNLTDTLSGNYEYSLVDKQGNRVSTANITRDTARVPVTIVVNQVKSVALQVNLTPDNSATAESASVSISPKTVKIIGDPNTVQSVKSITIGSININDADNGDTFDFHISAPTGVSLADGEPTTAQATLALDDTQREQFYISNISLNDTNPDKNAEVTLETHSLTVTLSGMYTVLHNVSADDITAVAEINSSELSEGRHTIGATVSSPEGTTVVGTYSVTVNIARSASNNEDEDTEPAEPSTPDSGSDAENQPSVPVNSDTTDTGSGEPGSGGAANPNTGNDKE